MNILKKFIGNIGEQYAEKYLKTHNHTIIDRQRKEKYVEIDILSEKDGIIYAFEVKTVSHETENVNNVSHRNNGHQYKSVNTMENKVKEVDTNENNHKNKEILIHELVSSRKVERMQRFLEHYLNRYPHYLGISMGVIVVKLVDEKNKPEITIQYI